MTKLTTQEISRLVSSLKAKKYKVYTRPYEMNIVGKRNKTTQPNKFDDSINVFYKNDKGQWEGYTAPATTDPGTYFLNKPIANLGAAILKEGQYENKYQIGLHRSKYEAVVQRGGPVTVYRDYNRDNVLDFNNGREETGMFGINIHKAGAESDVVNNWSAGCQVFQKSADFEEFMNLARKHKSLYGNQLTYTLLDNRAYMRGILRRTLYIVLAGAVVFGAYKLYQKA
jgi:hypothetical protein